MNCHQAEIDHKISSSSSNKSGRVVVAVEVVVSLVEVVVVASSRILSVTTQGIMQVLQKVKQIAM